MPESLEPKQSVGPKIIAGLLYALLGMALGYLIFVYEGGTPDEQVSPAELRRVLEGFRENQRDRLVRQAGEIDQMIEQMREIRDQRLSEIGAEEDIQAVLDEQERDARRRAEDDPEDESLHGAYDLGRALEQEMVTLYREYLAARMVAVRPSLTYAEAYDLSATPRPVRPDLDNDALYRDITTTRPGGGLDAFKTEITKSTIEMREMVENAEKLLAFTRKSNEMSDGGISVDMSPDDEAMIGYRGPELLPDELNFENEPDVGNFAAIPGRRLERGGDMADWLYVDSWYIIGPFPGDRRRENLDVRFGPEANVNLDDVFTGKDDRKIRWRYKKVGYAGSAEGQKTAHWKIEPPIVDTYAVYYAFTEIYSDMPREVWIATATDDYGKLWINDELVWQSPKHRKPYNATENIQRIELQQGQNKVLYRVENGGGTMGFSLMIRQRLE